MNKDTLEILLGSLGPNQPPHIRVSMSSKAQLDDAVYVGIAGLLLGLPVFGFIAISGDIVFRLAAIVTWAGLVVLTALSRSRKRS